MIIGGWGYGVDVFGKHKGRSIQRDDRPAQQASQPVRFEALQKRVAALNSTLTAKKIAVGVLCTSATSSMPSFTNGRSQIIDSIAFRFLRFGGLWSRIAAPYWLQTHQKVLVVDVGDIMGGRGRGAH